MARFAKRHAIPVHLTKGTALTLPLDFPATLVRFIDPHAAFDVDGLLVDPFPVPHDAREPVQYAFTDGAARLAVVTDLGMSTPHVEEKLTGCDALVLECNHDARMLDGGLLPANAQGAHLGAVRAPRQRARRRRSSRASTARASSTSWPPTSPGRTTGPELATGALAGALGCEESWIGVATQDAGFDWRSV